MGKKKKNFVFLAYVNKNLYLCGKYRLMAVNGG